MEGFNQDVIEIKVTMARIDERTLGIMEHLQKLNGRVATLETKRETDNRRDDTKFNEISRYIWMAIGGIMVLELGLNLLKK